MEGDEKIGDPRFRLVIAGEFRDFEHWVARAQSRLAGREAFCVDSKGRRCRIGSDMMRARDEGTFPVYYGWDFELEG